MKYFVTKLAYTSNRKKLILHEAPTCKVLVRAGDCLEITSKELLGRKWKRCLVCYMRGD